ncbi:MAG: hypothetical protein LBH27_02705, partial [Endomicrobium sp.]|nr:hypothetical protein [Endomicrobium sp.]
IELLNLKKSIFILENLINDKEEPLVILSVISSLIRRILYAKCIMKKQVSETYLNKFYENSFFENVSKHKTYILKKVLKMILNAHILIKTGRCDAAITLENIVLYICHNTNQ